LGKTAEEEQRKTANELGDVKKQLEELRKENEELLMKNKDLTECKSKLDYELTELKNTH